MESNVQKMMSIFRNIKHRIVQTQTDGTWSREDAHAICDSIDYALSLPLRNCDVGTAEEQDNRMDIYCQTRKCESCQLWDNVNNGVRCEFTWAQLPYEAKEGGAK